MRTWRACGMLLVVPMLVLAGCRRSSPENTREPCNNGAVMCGDAGRSLYRCEAGRWALWASCGGAEGCRESPAGVACDQSLGEKGARCAYPEARACSNDGHALLLCDGDGGRFEEVRACSGPLGCTLDAGSLLCDDSVAERGARCESHPRSFTCSRARDAILTCVGNAYAVLESCTPPKLCTIGADGGTIACTIP